METHKTCSFFGHRFVFNSSEVRQNLVKVIEDKISCGYDTFLVGGHGEFDNMVLSALVQLKKLYSITIKVVQTSFTFLKYKDDINSEFENLVYPIEEVYFKERITFTNKCMVNDSDLVVCYVDKNRSKSGAKNAMNYALKMGKEVINIYNL